MALINVMVSGTWRVSAVNGMTGGNALTVTTPLTAALGSLSVFVEATVVLATTVSELRVSYANLSNPQLIMMTADNEVRLNFAGFSVQPSAASASVLKFKEFFAMMDVSGLLPSGFSLGNSGTNSATVNFIIAG